MSVDWQAPLTHIRTHTHPVDVTHVADIWHHKQNENIKFSHLAMMSYHISPTHRQNHSAFTLPQMALACTDTLCNERTSKKEATTSQATQSFILYLKNTSVAIYSANKREREKERGTAYNKLTCRHKEHRIN